MMEQIPNIKTSKENPTQNIVGKVDTYAGKIKKGIVDKMFTILGFFIIVAYSLFSFLDVSLPIQINPLELSLGLVALYICVNSMFNNTYSAGIQAGKKEKIYTDSVDRHLKSKNKVKDTNKTHRIFEFCEYKSKQELKAARYAKLENTGIKYEDYEKKYLPKTNEEILLIDESELTDYQKSYIIEANNIKPILLRPDMFYFTGIGGNGKRRLLSTNPEKMAKRDKRKEAIQTLFTVFFLGVISLELLVSPSWGALGEYLLRMLPISIAAVTGYYKGFENRTVSAVAYYNDAADLCDEFIEWEKNNPEENENKEEKESA